MEDNLDKYILGLSSDTEKQELLKELDTDEALQRNFADKLNTLSLVMMQEKKGDRVYASRKLNELKQKTRKTHFRKIAVQLVRYAAVMLLTIGIYSLYQISQKNSLADEYALFEVPNGQRARLLLPDGSAVWLNAGSRLRYPTDFSAENRNVCLDGEAYFEVKGDDKNPFKVKTSLITVNVLGTKFNVKSYENELTYVTLMEGSVELNTEDKLNKLTLRPNEQVSISQDGSMTLFKKNELNGINSWTTGEFSYINQPLYSIVRDLERQYDLNITILDDELANDLFTSKSTEKENVVQILERLRETRELDYEIEENNIKIFKQ
ncbi:MAG: FecR domain-containing protein [Tannerella sp.]|nr:FecR domain-containing protein [Tannerella sp.]